MATRDVQFIIRARDEASRAFEGINNALEQLTQLNGSAGASSNLLSTDLGKLVQALGSVDQVARMVNGASNTAGNAFESQRAKVKALEGDLANLKSQSAAAANALNGIKAAGAATGNSGAEAAQIKAVQAAQVDLEKQIARKVTTLGREQATLESISKEYQRAASLANAFDAAQPGMAKGQEQVAAAQALQQQAAWVERIRTEMNPLVGIQQHYREEIEKANAAKVAGLYKSEAEYQAVVKLLKVEEKRALASAGVGPDGRPSMFGMKPWQATNLMYQVNDVVSGLAMGQKPSQIIAQQLGQIVQLFPRLGSGIMAAFGNPYLVVAAAAFAAIAYGVKQAADQAERLRTFAGILKATADGANYSAVALNDNVKALQAYHLTADEAVAITRQFVKDGLNPSYFEKFGTAAKDMSRVMGVDVKDAAQQVSAAFTGGYDAIAKLDDATHFLTASEREHIRTLFDSGHAADARAEAFDKFQKKQHDAATEMRGPWTEAIEHLDGAWHRFTASLADSGWSNALRNGLEGMAGWIEAIADAAERVNEADRQYALRQSGGSVTVKVPDATKATPEQEARAKAKANTPAAAAGSTDPRGSNTADQEAANAASHDIALQRQLQAATSDTAKIRVAGEQAYQAEIEKTGNTAVAALKRQAAEEQILTQIQMERRKGLLSSAEQFLGKRENNREDASVLTGLFNQYGVKTPQGGSVDPAKLAWCAAFVNAMLASKGLPTTGSLSASSFQKYGTGVKVEDAQPGDIVNFKGHVGFFAGFGPNNTVRILGGNQGPEGKGAVTVSNFKRSSVQSVRRAGPISEGYDQPDSEAQYAMQLAASQDSFNKKLEVEAATRQLVIKYMRDQLGLSAEALYASQKQEEIEKAILAAKQDATDKHIAFSPDQEAALRKQIGDQYDAEHAMALVNDRLKEQTDLRDALMQAITEASAHGDDATVARLTDQLNALTPALEDAIVKAEEFWKKLPDGPAKTAAIEGFRQLRDSIKDTAFQLDKLKVDKADLQVSGAEQLKGALTSNIDQLQLLGDKDGAKAAQSELTGVNNQLTQLIQNAIDAREAWLQLSDAQLAANGETRAGIEAQIIGLRQSQREAQMLGRQFLMTGRQINESLSDTATNAIDGFFQKIAQGQNVVAAFWQSLVQGIADFLRQIALAILKQTIFNALNHGGAGGGGGVGGSIATAIAGLFHGGGIAGAHQMSRSVSPAVFSNAIRYHTGGIAGLAPDEQASILKKGEEVLTEDNPRHRKNAGRAEPGSPPRGLRQILAIGDDEIANAMSGAAGDEVHFTWLRRNRATIRQELA